MVAAQFRSKLDGSREKFAMLWKYLDTAMLTQVVGVTNEIAGTYFMVSF